VNKPSYVSCAPLCVFEGRRDGDARVQERGGNVYDDLYNKFLLLG
jgi:hypothetical protein